MAIWGLALVDYWRNLGCITGVIALLLITVMMFLWSNNTRPSREMVRMIDAKLVQDSCFINLDEWSRIYRYNSRIFWTDQSVIEVSLFHSRQGPRLQIKSPQNYRIHLDERVGKIGGARYSVQRNELDVWACGSNDISGIRHWPRF